MSQLLESYFSKTAADKRKSSVIAYLAALDHLQEVAPSIAKNIIKELHDQRSYLKLIASENYTSLAVQLAMGNLLTDKYSEGFPYHRFYAGCENVDAIEQEACDLAQELFGADHAYVQPHSGADANLVAFWAILVQKVQSREIRELGKESVDDLTAEEYERVRQTLCKQTMMGMSLASGGHLSHGYRHNISAKMMRAVNYEVDPKSGLLNYDEIAKLARQEKPLILLAGYSAYPRTIDFAKMREIADEVGSVLMVDMAHFSGLVAGKVLKGNENPIPYAHITTSTTHKTLRGPRGGLLLCQKEFTDTVNKGCPLVLGGPLPHVIAAKAIAFKEASLPSFREYAQRVVTNAKALAEGLKREGIKLVTDGTDNHLVMIDLTNLGITGRQGEKALRKAGITANRNMIPFDKNGPWYTTGIRIGTAATSTLGMGTEEMNEIAQLIAKILRSTQPAMVEKTGLPSKAKEITKEEVTSEVKRRVTDLLHRFPLYPEINLT